MPQDAEHQHLQQHQHASGTEEPREPSNLQGDYHNVALLLVLYTLQGKDIDNAAPHTRVVGYYSEP